MRANILPNSWTALPSVGAVRPEESIFVAGSAAGLQIRAEPNASIPAPRELSDCGPRWLRKLAFAGVLTMQEIELANRPSTYYLQMLNQDNATAVYVKSPEETAREEILSAVGRMPSEELEDGMTYELGRSVISLVNEYHELAITTFAEVILGEEVSPERASHTLRWVGRMKDETTDNSRLRLLGRGLKARSPVVRDGASLGLAALGNREAIPMLRRAVHDEPVETLRRDLEQVLEELEESR